MPVNDGHAQMIEAAGRIGSMGMKTERRGAMSIQTFGGAALQSNQWTVDLEAGQDNDARLLAAAMSGHSVAFGELFNRYRRRIFHLAQRIMRNHEDAEDVVQEAFQLAFVHLRDFKGGSRFSTWLSRIAINVALMKLRKKRVLEQYELEGRSMKEIAEGLGISVAAVKARIFHARPKMRHELDQYFIKRAERRKRLRFGTASAWNSNGRELRAVLS